MATATLQATEFKPKELPYSKVALQPVMSSETIDYHFGKHYVAYVNKLNELIKGTPFEGKSLEQIVKESYGAIFNNAAQVWNHEFYYWTFSPDAKTAPTGALLEAINKSFGSFDKFKEQMQAACMSLFGSGWVWLAEAKDGSLSIIKEPNAGNPLKAGLKPLLGIDVWEHAYYLDYRNRRAEAVSELWKITDWRVVEMRYEE